MRGAMKPSFGIVCSLLSLLAACTAGGSDDGSAPETCPSGAASQTLAMPGSAAGGLEEVTSFGENPAGLKMYVHAPARKTPVAVVLALHGCTQHAADYVQAGWNDLADREGLVVVYGEQTAQNNSMQCFRWWDPAQIGRDGEAKSLASMVTAAHAKYGTSRAFVTGLSAGGAMTTVMLAAYPELFEAGAIMAGLPYKCATSQLDAYTCMSGRDQSADAWAALVPKTSNAPRVSIWQGDADWTVRPSNREELVKQWTKVNGVSETPSDSTTDGRATHYVHRDASGVVRVESWSVSGMAHGVAIDAKAGCGSTGPYALDVGVCSTTNAALFFLGKLTGAPEAGATTGGSSAPASNSSNPCK